MPVSRSAKAAREGLRAGSDGPPPLLLACALGIERFALRGGDHGGAPAPVVTLRTGMGPRAATDAVRHVLGDGPATARVPVVATGFCAGLVPGMRPGTWSSPTRHGAICRTGRTCPAPATVRCCAPWRNAV